jgi:hypothetical protein
MLLLNASPASFAVTLGSGLLATGAWVYNFFIRGEKLVARHVEALTRRRRELSLEEVAGLEREFESLGHTEGAAQARELRQSFSTLDKFLKEKARRTGGLGVQRLRVLGEDTYREGLGLLRKALEVYRALRSVDAVKLERELEAWRQELAAQLSPLPETSEAPSPGERKADPRVKALQSRIEAHEKRLSLHRERQHSLVGILAETERLEAALESSYLQVVDLDAGDTTLAGSDAATSLERAVEAAEKVEARLRGLGEDREDEKIYLEAGRTAS